MRLPGDPETFTEAEQEEIRLLNRALLEAWGPGGSERQHKDALRRYLQTMSLLGRRFRMFEIANHRLFRTADGLIVPYDAHGLVCVWAVRADGDELLARERFPHGTIVTDRRIAELAGRDGEPVDLEREIYHLDVEDMPAIRITRIRDMARLLERLNACGSRHEAVFLLRFLVARLCSASFQGFPGAKNLQPEVVQLRRELSEVLNGPFAYRMRLPMRILVRNVSGLVSRPKLIDELWQDTIDLAEVHVRGSAITNEIRRTAHHALGQRTLRLARAYLGWLDTGSAEFPDSERERPGSADEAARHNPLARSLVARIVATLEQLLGSTQIATRFAEWREAYADELARCSSRRTVDEELEDLVELGIRAGNRYSYQHHVRTLARKVDDGHWTDAARAPFEVCLARLEAARPGAPDFDAEATEREARGGVSAFLAQIAADHQDQLFRALDRVLADYERGAYLASYERACDLRREIDELETSADQTLVGRGVFREQRYLLHQLDCLLEEMGYFALRHAASRFDDQGVRLQECLRIVHRCASCLGHDGLFSRELWDLSVMLIDPARTRRELLDVLEQVQRTYHRLIFRVSAAFESMSERLGYGPDELRAVLANFQRTMHDLNSLVHFADLARAELQEGAGAGVAEPAGAEPEVAPADGADRQIKLPDPWDFVHLSHTADVARRVESWEGPSLLDRYGGKGSGLLYVGYLGAPTRDGFVVPTTLPRLGLHEREPERLEREVLRHVRILEEDLERTGGSPVRLGDPAAPLFLAVRGGSVFSMPGMLSTVVFVGITDAVAEALAEEDAWYAWDAYRRFLVSWSAAAWNRDVERLDLVEEAKRRHGVEFKIDLPGEAMRDIVLGTLDALRGAGHGEELDRLLRDPEQQLFGAVRAVHASWNLERARRYRAIKRLGDGWHTAVIVQQMASGNRSNEAVQPGMDEGRVSLTGVIPCTRMRSTGFRAFTGDVKFSACGDDLVGGQTATASYESVQELRKLAPMLERRLNHVDARLRRFCGTDPEIEFTVERGVLSVLQARSAQPETHVAAANFDDPGLPAARGIGIRGGAFRGVVAFDEADLERLSAEVADREETDGVLLVLENPTPDEIPLILAADALLTERGGSTSHAAVAVHGIEDKPYCAVLGAPTLHVDAAAREATIVDEDGQPTHTVRTGDVMSIHGQTGEVFVGTRHVHSSETEEPEAAASPAGT